MTQSQRAVFGEWLGEVGVSQARGVNYRMQTSWNVWDGWAPYEPWWWFFTRDDVAGLLSAAGFDVENVASYWAGRATFYDARARPETRAPAQ